MTFVMKRSFIVLFKMNLQEVDNLLMWSVTSLDLQHLLSSSMDKTVRLWDMETKTCLKLFAHNDYGETFLLNKISSY